MISYAFNVKFLGNSSVLSSYADMEMARILINGMSVMTTNSPMTAYMTTSNTPNFTPLFRLFFTIPLPLPVCS